MNESVHLHDKKFEIYLGEHELQTRIKELAFRITQDYKNKQPIILSILNGSFIFTADLVRYFEFPMTIEFVRYSSYEGTKSTGEITQMLGMKSDITDQDVLIIEDIIDTGRTLHYALQDLKKQNPKSLEIVSLLVKPDAAIHDVPCRYVGFNIPNDFVVGYGLDYDELGRDLRSIYKLS